MKKLFLLIGIFMVAMVSSVFGASNITCAVTNPAASETVIGTFYPNVTVSCGGAGCKNVSVCSLSYGTVTTLNDTLTGTQIANFSIDTRTLYDTSTYTFSATCYNTSAAKPEQADCTTSTGVTPDNTNPVVSITTPVTGSRNKQGFVFSGSCVNATSAILYLDADTYTAVVSGSAGSETCDYTFLKGRPVAKTYNTVYISAKDLNADETTSLATPFVWTVTEDSSTAKAVAIMQAQAEAEGEELTQDSGGFLSITEGGVFSMQGLSDEIFEWSTLIIIGVALLIFNFAPVIGIPVIGIIPGLLVGLLLSLFI